MPIFFPEELSIKNVHVKKGLFGVEVGNLLECVLERPILGPTEPAMGPNTEFPLLYKFPTPKE